MATRVFEKIDRTGHLKFVKLPCGPNKSKFEFFDKKGAYRSQMTRRFQIWPLNKNRTIFDAPSGQKTVENYAKYRWHVRIYGVPIWSSLQNSAFLQPPYLDCAAHSMHCEATAIRETTRLCTIVTRVDSGRQCQLWLRPQIRPVHFFGHIVNMTWECNALIKFNAQVQHRWWALSLFSHESNGYRGNPLETFFSSLAGRLWAVLGEHDNFASPRRNFSAALGEDAPR